MLIKSIDLNRCEDGAGQEVVTVSTGVHTPEDKANNGGNEQTTSKCNVQGEELLATSTHHEEGNTQNGQNNSGQRNVLMTLFPMVKEHEQVVGSDVNRGQATIILGCTEQRQVSIEDDKSTRGDDSNNGEAPEVATSPADPETDKTEHGKATWTPDLVASSIDIRDDDKESATDISDGTQVQITSNDVEPLSTNLCEGNETADDETVTSNSNVQVEQALPSISEHKLGAEENGGERTPQLDKRMTTESHSDTFS